MKHKISSIVLCNVFIEASCDILSKYPLIMEIPFDAILYSKLGNEISDASHNVHPGRIWPTGRRQGRP